MKHYNGIGHFPSFGVEGEGATLIGSNGERVTYPFGKVIKLEVHDDDDGIVNIKDLDTGVVFYNISKDSITLTPKELSHA